ncbi:MAG: hypothetical protein E6987_01435, partial [Peptoniphilus harei]|nr:hypothetical protein [Peptoniphilus harei]
KLFSISIFSFKIFYFASYITHVIYDVEDNLHAREEKPSILGQISKFKSEEEKDKNQEKSEKGQER